MAFVVIINCSNKCKFISCSLYYINNSVQQSIGGVKIHEEIFHVLYNLKEEYITTFTQRKKKKKRSIKSYLHYIMDKWFDLKISSCEFDSQIVN